MINPLKALDGVIERLALEMTFLMSGDLNYRQIELWKILRQHLPEDFVPYSMISDIVKSNAQHLYSFGTRLARVYVLLGDLRALAEGNYLEHTIFTHPEFGNMTDGYRIGWKEARTKKEFFEEMKMGKNVIK
jgi:hypothetical protein